MKKVKVPMFGNPNRVVNIESGATDGARIGINLALPDGSIPTLPELAAALAVKAPVTAEPSGGLPFTIWPKVTEKPPNIVQAANLNSPGLVERKADGSWTTRAIAVASTSRLKITNGAGENGNPTLDLAKVANASTGDLLALTRDAYGRVAGTRTPDTDDLAEGTSNQYFTDGRAQDAIGAILDDASTGDIDFEYVSGLISGRVVRMSVDAVAGEALSSNRVVCLQNGKAYYPDLTEGVDIASIVGLAFTSAATNAAVTVMTSGTLHEAAWNWSAGRIYCDPTDGKLTQTPPTTGAVCEVARVIDSQTIEVGIRPAILRE